jgi:histone H3/H4
LVVVSKLKKYIRAKSGMNTSDNVTNVLSDHLRELCVQAIRHAAESERRTVMDRDFAAILIKR